MKANQIKRNIVEKFIMTEFVNDRLNTQSAIDNMIAVVSKKLSISNKEAGEFICEAING